MVQNPARRTALADAAIDVLAREGARGLTFRAVDVEAGVPNGTASNYFANRDDLLHQTARHIHHRLTPDPLILAELLRAPRDRALVTALMHDLIRRISADRAGYLAMLELRLEATRRPELRTQLTGTIREDLENNIAYHLAEGLPGDRDTVVVLYLAMTGLILEHLTLPEVLGVDGLAALVDTVVGRTVPAT
ncbi:TetR family transcriptional regulator [Kitasatospora aureofaciens]|uniref:TetR/AcrR family transcriptional regulator n=1 Tax=Kitasatospora aureofaciens TaxID=1894 RepID=UPI001C486A09|nr:TetR/AcrR family transcriptional regulator [Kitasatospora aureofaciens]MBV6697943.1 TetR family transcriptional regulator [Kitasatospora aureofaciens]